MSHEHTESERAKMVHQPLSVPVNEVDEIDVSQPLMNNETVVLYEGPPRRFQWLTDIVPSTSAKWWLVILGIGLAWVAQSQFDSYRLQMQLDSWHFPTLVAVIGAFFFGIALYPVAMERLPVTSKEWLRPYWGTLVLALIINLVSLSWFTGNTVRLSGVILWLASIGLGLFALRRPAFFSELRTQLTTFAHTIYPVRSRLLLFVAIMLLGFFFRFYRLDNLPNEIALDQLSKFWDVHAMRDGRNIHVFFPANQGREGGFFHFVWLMSYFVGLNFFTLKLSSALIGLITIAVSFFMARELFNSEVAFLTMFLLSIDKWHVILSRVGYRISLLPLAVMLTILFLARVLRTGRMLDYGLTGVALGFGMYTYKSFPFAWIATAIVLLLFSWRRRDLRIIWGGVVTLFCGLLVYAPMGLYAYEFWETYTYRETLQMGFMEDALRHAGLTYWEGMAINLRKSLLMFNYIGEPIDLFNIPFERHFNFGNAILYILGMGYLLVRVRDGHNAILPIFIFLLTLPMTMAMFPPQEQPSIFRASGTIGPAILVSALPLVGIRRFLTETVPKSYQNLSLSLSSPSPDAAWQRTLTFNVPAFGIAAIILVAFELRAGYDTIFNRFSDYLQDAKYPLSLDITWAL